MLLLLIILGFWGVLGLCVGFCLGLGWIGVEISMVVGIFVGVILGSEYVLVGLVGKWLKGLVLVGLVVVGRG